MEFKLAKVTIEVGRGKKLWEDPDAPLTISPSVAIVHPNTKMAFETQTLQETTDPFFNSSHDVMIEGKALPPPVGLVPFIPPPQMPQKTAFHFVLRDNNGGDEPKEVAYASLVVKMDANGKGEDVLMLRTQPSAAHAKALAKLQSASSAEVVDDPIEEEEKICASEDDFRATGEDRGELVLRYKVLLPKPKPVDVNEDVHLDFVPQFDGKQPLLAENRQYVWWHLFGGLDSGWRDKFNKAMCEGYTPTEKPKKGEKAHNPKSLADVLINFRKVKRSHQLHTLVRLGGEKYAAGLPVVSPPEEEVERKRKWKEFVILRSNAAQEAQKTRELMERYWLLFVVGVPVEQSYQPTFEHRAALNSAKFDRAQYEILQGCLLQAVVPGLTSAQAHEIAKEDFINDPVYGKQPQPSESAATPNPSAGNDGEAAAATTTTTSKEDLRAAVAGIVDDIALDAEKRRATATALAKLSATELMFGHVLRTFACYWAESYTEAEFAEILKALTPALMAAKPLCAQAAAGTDFSSLKLPKGASGGKKSGRRKSTANSPRSARSSSSRK